MAAPPDLIVSGRDVQRALRLKRVGTVYARLRAGTLPAKVARGQWRLNDIAPLLDAERAEIEAQRTRLREVAGVATRPGAERRHRVPSTTPTTGRRKG